MSLWVHLLSHSVSAKPQRDFSSKHIPSVRDRWQQQRAEILIWNLPSKHNSISCKEWQQSCKERERMSWKWVSCHLVLTGLSVSDTRKTQSDRWIVGIMPSCFGNCELFPSIFPPCQPDKTRQNCVKPLYSRLWVPPLWRALLWNEQLLPFSSCNAYNSVVFLWRGTAAPLQWLWGGIAGLLLCREE